jgi:UDP-GlcNAc3NAcA epimerase
MKIFSVVGARPEFVQSEPVSRALRAAGHTEVLVHTGQHYDYAMSQAFFDELGIPSPDYNLEVGSGLQGKQTGEMLARIEALLLDVRPDLVIVRGDTNSTLAGALAASKLGIPLLHLEAGERSYNRREPEEINRLVADRIADLHFCASHAAVDHLANEGVRGSVHWVGDVMLDALVRNLPIAKARSNVLERLGLSNGQYSLVTVHRAANTDDPNRLGGILAALNRASEKIVFPVHPRTRKALASNHVHLGAHILAIEPVGYFDIMMLEENARLIATDSGGVQREAYFLGVPCLTLRDETEWTETLATGWNQLVGADSDRIEANWATAVRPSKHPPIFGDGSAGKRIAEILDVGLATLLP